MLEAQGDKAELEPIISDNLGWDGLQNLVATAAGLTDTMSADPLAHVTQGYNRFRRYAPRMLRILDIHGAAVAMPLLKAACSIRDGADTEHSTGFLRRTSKWHQHLKAQDDGDLRLWEVAVLFHLRDAFRSGDIWLRHSKRYGDLKQILVPAQAITANARLMVPFNPEAWIADRKARMEFGLKRLVKAARSGTIPGGSIENGVLHVDRLSANVPHGADEMIIDLYKRMPEVRITDILMDVDAATGFTDAFTHLRTGVPCKDKLAC